MKDCRLFAVFVNAREVMIAPFGASSRLLGRFWTQLATTFCPEVVQRVVKNCRSAFQVPRVCPLLWEGPQGQPCFARAVWYT